MDVPEFMGPMLAGSVVWRMRTACGCAPRFRYQESTIIDLPIRYGTSISEVLGKMTAPEVLDGEKDMPCNACGTRFVKQDTIHKLGPGLQFNFLRFTKGDGSPVGPDDWPNG